MSGSEDLVRLRTYIEREAQAGNRRLPPEPKLAMAINVSRGRLRTLLKKAEGDGLIWRHVGKGTFIGERELHSAHANGAVETSLSDIMSARVVLEPQLARQAAINACPADIVAMEDCLSGMTNAVSFAEWKHLDDRLHRRIATATRNPLLLVMYDTLRVEGRRGLDSRLNAVYGEMEAPRATNLQHEQIVAAITSGDPKSAQKLMEAHILGVRHRLFGLS